MVNFKSLWEVRTEHLGKALPQLPQTGPDDGPCQEAKVNTVRSRGRFSTLWKMKWTVTGSDPQWASGPTLARAGHPGSTLYMDLRSLCCPQHSVPFMLYTWPLQQGGSGHLPPWPHHPSPWPSVLTTLTTCGPLKSLNLCCLLRSPFILG